MSTPRHAFDDQDSTTRTYIHPRTQETFTSVTTALGIIEKTMLPRWYGKMSAISALTNLDRLTNAATAGRATCDGTFCGRCLTCIAHEITTAGEQARDAAADRGTRLHHVAETYALTGEIIGHDQDIAPHVANFEAFIKIHQVTFQASEVTVLNRATRWGGTLDSVITCGWMPPKHVDLIGVPLIADYKTSNHIYPRDGLQLAAYRHGEAVLLPDGSEHPLPDANPNTGLSIQITAGGFWVRPCPVGDAPYAKFLRALSLWRDLHEPDLDLVGRAMYKRKKA